VNSGGAKHKCTGRISFVVLCVVSHFRVRCFFEVTSRGGPICRRFMLRLSDRRPSLISPSPHRFAFVMR
jgi:hypothetical protein